MSSNKQASLGFFSLTVIVISLVIGMGIFKTPATIAAKAGSSTIFFTAWILGGFISLLGALTYAEIGQKLPAVGGYYKIFAYAYHPAIGFTINALILISNAASLAVVTLIGADYAADLLYAQPASNSFNIVVAIVPIGIFYMVNLLGLKTSSTTQNILTVVKVALVVLLIGSVFQGVTVMPHGHTNGHINTYNGSNGLVLLMLSLVAISFSYGGYQQTINFGGEVKNTAILPKGIIAGIAIVTLLYLCINYAYVQVVGFNNMKNATAIGALLCEAWFGKIGGKVFDACMFLSVMAYVNVILLSNPRVMYAMSKDGVFPKTFAYQNSKTQALTPALTVFALTAVIVVFFGKGVDDVISFSMFLDCFGMVLSAIALFILRKKMPSKSLSFFSKNIMPIVAILFIIAYAVIATAIVMDNIKAALVGIVLMIVFLGIYRLVYYKK